MKMITYASSGALRSVSMDRPRIEGVMMTTAESTDTNGLIVILEISEKNAGWGGSFCTGAVTPKRLGRMKGVWREEHATGVPPGLPDSFRLIEMRIGVRRTKYPRIEYNRNGFKLWFADLSSHLAYLFGHELHHFRRYSLGMHHREGEKSADRWAAARAEEMGYAMTLKPFKIRGRARRRSRKRRMGPTVMSEQEWNKIRGLPSGSQVALTRSDSRKLPAGSVVSFVRPMRASYRVLVRDNRGDERLVPIEWLRIVEVSSTESSTQTDNGYTNA